jgi:hypothetical protein
MHPPLRIAILECGEPPERTKATVGGYGDVFRLLLEQGAAKLVLQNGLHLTYWDVEKGTTYPKLDDIDAILMTGSSGSDCRDCIVAESDPKHRAQLVRRRPLDP